MHKFCDICQSLKCMIFSIQVLHLLRNLNKAKRYISFRSLVVFFPEEFFGDQYIISILTCVINRNRKSENMYFEMKVSHSLTKTIKKSIFSRPRKETEEQKDKQKENLNDNILDEEEEQPISIKMMETKFIHHVNDFNQSQVNLKKGICSSRVDQLCLMSEESICDNMVLEKTLKEFKEKSVSRVRYSSRQSSQRSSRYSSREKNSFSLMKGRQSLKGVSGNVKMILKHGVVFEGYLEKGVAKSGKMTFQDGSVYQGELNDFKFEGYGRLKTQDGKIFQGSWKKGKIQNTGTIMYPNKDFYKGEITNYKKHGKGRLSLSNGSHYQGEFVGGDITGYGKYFTQGKLVAEGHWKQGLFLGKNKQKEKKSENIEFLA